MGSGKVIVLDPGHSDYTHKFPGGYREGVLVRKAAILAASMLRKPGHTVHLTRDEPGEDPGLSDRGRLAVNRGADVFVSLHTNAAVRTNGSYAEGTRGVYGIFYGKSTRENTAPDSQISAPNGRRLARLISQETADILGMPLRGHQGAKVWWRCPKNLGVLTGGGCWRNVDAACLIEAGYGTSPQDRAILNTDEGIEGYAFGVCRGIHRHLGLAFPEAWLLEGEGEDDDAHPGQEPADEGDDPGCEHGEATAALALGASLVAQTAEAIEDAQDALAG